MTPPAPDHDRAAEYLRRRDSRREDTARFRAREGRLSSGRLGVAILGAALLYLVLGPRVAGPVWILLPVAGFVALVVVHVRTSRHRRRSERAEAFYEAGLARLEDRWPGTGTSGDRYLDDAHPYAPDLDLYGRGSLFELLCTARTRGGEDVLAAWLGASADLDEVRARQEAVEELRERLDLREELALLGDEVRVGIHDEELQAWGEAPARLSSGVVPLLGAALSVAALITALLGAWMAFAFVVVAEIALALVVRRSVAEVLEEADRSAAELDLLSRLLDRVEREQPSCERLRRIHADLATEGAPPSRRIAQLRRLVQLLDARRNQLFAPVAGLLMWGTQIAFALERWRARWGTAVGRWLRALGELETLLALASHAHEHPSDPFPELVDGERCFDGRDLGHPLLPEGRCVTNDLRFEGERRLFLVSGSNMSGKSTLLRTVGTNAALALAGGTVRARRLRLSRLQVAASMRTRDSLLDGRSRFYAEIERLKQVVDLAEGDVPALFLLDELLHGTNSHDRAIGAEAVVTGLVRREALGLVTTHDLTLARIPDALGERAVNVHFEDRIEDGRIVFDYRLRDGVVTKSNALDLMRAVGLDVEAPGGGRGGST